MTPKVLKALVDDAEYQRSKGHTVNVIADEGVRLTAHQLALTEDGEVLNVMLPDRETLYRIDAARVVAIKYMLDD